MLLKSSYLGIDLRADNIKVAHLVKKRNKNIIKNLYQIANPIGKTVFRNQQEQDAIRHVLIKIKEMLPSKGVIMGISSNCAAFRYVHFPLMSKKELRDAIYWEIQEFDTVFSSEYISDYELLDQQNNTCRVLLVAVPKDLIMAYTNILSGAGFYLKALDVYPLANARVLKAQKKSGVSAIIDFDVTHSEITVVENGKLVLNRNLNFPHIITVENFILEISRIFNFYSLQSKGHQVEEIILLGKGSKLKDVIKSYFNMNVIMGNELECDFTAENSRITHNPMDFFSAIGFALRG